MVASMTDNLMSLFHLVKSVGSIEERALHSKYIYIFMCWEICLTYLTNQYYFLISKLPLELVDGII